MNNDYDTQGPTFTPGVSGLFLLQLLVFSLSLCWQCNLIGASGIDAAAYEAVRDLDDKHGASKRIPP
jgi:hypothetical protein